MSKQEPPNENQLMEEHQRLLQQQHQQHQQQYPPPAYDGSGNQGVPVNTDQPQMIYPPGVNQGGPIYVNQPQAGYPAPMPGGIQGDPVYANQPQPGFVAPPPGQHLLINSIHLGDVPVEMVCPSCRHHIKTNVVAESGPGAYISALVIALFGCFCGCCLIPFGIDSMKIFSHRCPNCKILLGKYAGSNSFGSSQTYVASVQN